MRLRFRSITYMVGGPSASLDRHYRELRESMLRAGARYGLQSASPWRPPIDIHETPAAIVVKMELAGVGEDDIEITLYDNAVVVSGQRENDIPLDEAIYYHEAQVRYGPFRADILLPVSVDPDAVEATYDHGFLRVRLPKLTRIEGGGDEKARSASETGSGGTQAEPRSEPPASESLASESPVQESLRSAGDRRADTHSAGPIRSARAGHASGVHASSASRRPS